ncbi:hypothetical protein BAR24066_07364 [Burkholderia arboris]|uniref:Uncharacterized protein n=1 Tax=Burkholderia arboris TaxID=488730 RepID=A0A9Q9SRN0_9BURK|nr:hypothetical protein [Burkholderia arboris]VWC45966.1 hypothetical protein BAR24066_07364 [Burkholderia arboris]
MADTNLTRDELRARTKYRMVIAAAGVMLVAAVVLCGLAYWQHIELLNKGDELGTRMLRLGSAIGEGTHHDR